MPRFTSEELRYQAGLVEPTHIYGLICRQAADDAETLKGIRAWLEAGTTPTQTARFKPLRQALDELNRLEAKR